ncbi:hypothetical protein [Ghiorsea bivora]|uniref:hypothetical protein n=1 Tax=Ghiorsea bivora TaxID=1485545 RepID=UPI00056E7673|nr:hypothetical protein [Ghiorsea bivora]
MDEYRLLVNEDAYGPYHSKEQAKFAADVFMKKHPDMQEQCVVQPICSRLEYVYLFEPQLLH